MKKRLLALALCLVMMTSLLPITALADGSTVEYVCAVGDGEDGDSWLSGESWNQNSTLNKMNEISDCVYEITYRNVMPAVVNDSKYEVKFALNGTWDHAFGGTFVGSGVAADAVYHGNNIKFFVPYESANITLRLDLSNFTDTTKEGAKFTITITDANHNFYTGWTSDESSHWHKCLNEGCTEVKDKAPHIDNNKDHFCDDCGASVHTWQFKAAGNNLTGNCLYCRKEVSVSLVADSVTLPKSPFNAKLVGEDSFKAVFTNAVFDDIRYDYEESEGVWDYGIDPIAANAKAGNYQAFVSVSGLPGHVVLEGDEENPNGEGYLYVKYTAVDPAVTAQTGDNRPIELMLVSVVVFSALAAAAFIADSKRRLQQ